MRRGMPVNVKGSSPAHNSSPSPASLGGVGIVFQAGQPGGGLVVASLAVDGPADQSGQVLACDCELRGQGCQQHAASASASADGGGEEAVGGGGSSGETVVVIIALAIILCGGGGLIW